MTTPHRVVLSPVVDRLSTFRVIGVHTAVGAFVYEDGRLVEVDDLPVSESCPICDAEFADEKD